MLFEKIVVVLFSIHYMIRLGVSAREYFDVTPQRDQLGLVWTVPPVNGPKTHEIHRFCVSLLCFKVLTFRTYFF